MVNSHTSGGTPPSHGRPAGEDLTVARRPAQAEIRLSPPATAVFELLSARDADVGAWYRGAIVVLQTENPDRFAQAAHSLREVMNEVGRLAGLPQPEEEGGLGVEFKKMKETFSRAKDRSRCHDGEQWSGEIDAHARAAFVAIEEVIAWDDANRQARRQTFIAARRALDGSGRALPKAEEDRLWRAWKNTRNYFISVAHHGRKAEETEFAEHLDRLDGFIRRMFEADAYREQRRIMGLIQEAERGS